MIFSRIFFCFIVLSLASCVSNSDNEINSIIENAELEKITDQTYYFPANFTEEDSTAYLPLRRWDIIFTGAMKPDAENEERTAIDRLIPGYFNHILVYLGKDSEDIAYAVELNVDNLAVVDSKLVVDGGAKLLAISKDYGKEPQATGGHVIDRNYYLVRWAKTFTPEIREKVLARDSELELLLKQHLSNSFPYQLEFKLPSLPLLLIKREVKLVDDGLNGGAGCGDYWSSLFEEVADVCFYNVRASAAELVDYYTNDTVGRQAFVPAQWNPLGNESIYIHELLELGFFIREDQPHTFKCDNSSESGIVLPEKIFESDLLQSINHEENTVLSQLFRY